MSVDLLRGYIHLFVPDGALIDPLTDTVPLVKFSQFGHPLNKALVPNGAHHWFGYTQEGMPDIKPFQYKQTEQCYIQNVETRIEKADIKFGLNIVFNNNRANRGFVKPPGATTTKTRYIGAARPPSINFEPAYPLLILQYPQPITELHRLDYDPEDDDYHRIRVMLLLRCSFEAVILGIRKQYSPLPLGVIVNRGFKHGSSQDYRDDDKAFGLEWAVDDRDPATILDFED